MLQQRIKRIFHDDVCAKRIALSSKLRFVPSRSEIIRIAQESYLDLKCSGEKPGAPPVAV